MAEEEQRLEVAVAHEGGALGQLVRYFLVSLGGLMVEFAFFALLTYVFSVHYLIANPVAFVLGALAVYIGSIRWVFDVRREQNRAIEFLVFISVGILGLLVNELVLWLGVEFLALMPVPAKIIAAGASFLFNFVVRKLALFR